MDLQSGFNVENWESEGNFKMPVNEDVTLVLTEDGSSKPVADLPQLTVAAPSEESATLHEQHHYGLEPTINMPLAGDFTSADEVLVESNLEVPVAQENIELYEQQFIDQHLINSPQKGEISSIPLPNEIDMPTQSFTQSERSNQTVDEVAQTEKFHTPNTDNLNGLPFPQETSSVVVDEAVPTSDSSAHVQENVPITSNETKQHISGEGTEYVVTNESPMETESEVYEAIVSETIVEELSESTKVDMTEELQREPEDLVADLNSSEENNETQSVEESAIEYDNSAECILPAIAIESDGESVLAANGKSVIDLVLPVMDVASVTMTDPVLLRPGKPSTATRKATPASTKATPVSTKVTPASTKATPASTKVTPASTKATPASTNIQDAEAESTFFTLPAHVIGRPSENPTEEQKLRPGIKNSVGHLRSQILSKDDLAHELAERTLKNVAYSYPEKGDIFFAKTLTKRLANRLNPKVDSTAQDSTGGVAKLANLPLTLTAFKESKAKQDLAQTSIKAEANTAVQNDGKQDDTDLLAILEGDVDDWSIDRPPPQLIEAASSPINIQSHPPKLDPSMEREMALKQLSNMPVRKSKKRMPSLLKPMVKKSSRKAKIEVRPEFADDDLESMERPLRKRKAELPVVATKKAFPHSNGASDSVTVTTGKDVNKNIAKVKVPPTDVKQPRIFKTKRLTGGLTNGTTAAATKVSNPSTSNEGATNEASDEPIQKHPIKAPEVTDVPTLVKREFISPPRTYSSRIKKSTFSDDFVFPSTSKSRVVPVVGGPLKEKVAKLQKVTKPATPKVETVTSGDLASPVAPAPKRPVGRPPKNTPKVTPKKMKAAEPVAVLSPETPKSPTAKSAKKIPKKLSEIDRLLMDEGAINMLYSVEQNEEKRRSGGAEEPAVKKRVLKTTRHSHKELLMKTRLVKSAVQRLRNTPETSAVSLRTKRASGPPMLQTQKRKISVDSNVSLQSPPSLTPAEPSSPTQVFNYPPRLRTPAEASRIIRRHSSSSNFSSRSASPTTSRRLSVDVTAPNDAAETNSETVGTRETRKRSSNLYITKLQNTSSSKKKKIATRTASVEDAIFQPTVKTAEDLLSPTNKTKLQNQMAKNFQKAVKGKQVPGAVKKSVSTESAKSTGKQRKSADGKTPDLTACLAEAVTAFIAEDGNLDSTNVPPELNTESCLLTPISPSAGLTYSNLIKALEGDCQRRAEDSAKERTSPRQSAGLGSFKELSIRRHDSMVQIILAPVSTQMMDSLNPQVLKELQDVLNHLQKDDSCRAVLVTSTGSSFCLGLDFHSLIIEKVEKRKATALQFATALKHFMTSLSQFNKPIIAGVHGAAVGLGVTMLPFFDMVFASDKATFYTPYAKLGQVPEGAAVVTLPQLLGNAVTSELLYACRKLTASEALQYGLVTRILWPDRFHEELLPLINTLAAQSAQSMEATKALLRYNLRARVDAALESEAQLLVQHWSSPECQANFKRFLDDQDIGLQRQRTADA